jgi:hypothetical protein
MPIVMARIEEQEKAWSVPRAKFSSNVIPGE